MIVSLLVAEIEGEESVSHSVMSDSLLPHGLLLLLLLLLLLMPENIIYLDNFVNKI